MKSTLLLTLLLTVSMAGCGGSNTNTSSASTPTTTATASAVTMAAPTTIGKIEDISNAQLQTLLDQGVTLVDIRLPEEWKQTGVVKAANSSHYLTPKGN